MANPASEPNGEALKLDFGRRLMLRFRGSVVASDAGLLGYHELNDALGLSAMAGGELADARTGKMWSEAETSRHPGDVGFVAGHSTVKEPKCPRS